MADRPIIFSGPMVRALLDGRKSMTRRVLKPQPDAGMFFGQMTYLADQRKVIARNATGMRQDIPVTFAPGERLWVKEGFVTGFDIDDEMGRPIGDRKTWYRATDAGLTWYDPDTESTLENPPWKPSIFMPRWASRLTLTVTDVRVQRVQDISEADAVAEGWPGPMTDIGYPISTPRQWFAGLWNRLHRHDAWDANPWVVALTFTVERRNIDAGGNNG